MREIVTVRESKFNNNHIISTINVYRYKLPSWAMFELGRSAVYWKTMNGLPPTSVSIVLS